MTKKKVTTPTTAAGSEVTAERLRAFLAHPDVKEGVKVKVRKLVGQLYEAGDWDTLPEAPELYALEFEQTYINDHLARGTAQPDEREIYEKLAAAIDRHEPKDARLVRRLSAILRDPKANAETVERLGYIMCELSNETRTDDLHPDVFETLARVYIREARLSLKELPRGADSTTRDGSVSALRTSLRELEAIAAGE